MIECKKCGFVNKYSGKCKKCGTVNAPKYTLGETIANMSQGQLIYAVIAMVIYLIYAVVTAISLFGTLGTYSVLAETGSFDKSLMPVVIVLVCLSLILLAAIVVCAFFAYIKQGIFATIIQIFWFCGAAFSVWAIGAIDYNIFMLALVSSLFHAFLITIYRSKFANV